MGNILKVVYKKHKIKRYFQLFVGLLLMAFAFNLFILPNDLVFGGVSGIGIIVTHYVNIDFSLFVLIVSVFLLILSYIFFGKEVSRNSVLGSILFPIFLKLTALVTNYINLDMSDQLLFALVGGAVYGFGAGLVFKAGFTTGGTDVLNQILSKYAKISMGNSMLIIDGLIVISGAFVFGFLKFMYAIIILYIISILTDKVLIGISESKAFYIITSKKEEVCDFVINELNHSITTMDAKGGFSNKKNPVLFTVIPTKEYFKFKQGIKMIDKDAFFTVIDAYEVMGGE